MDAIPRKNYQVQQTFARSTPGDPLDRNLGFSHLCLCHWKSHIVDGTPSLGESSPIDLRRLTGRLFFCPLEGRHSRTLDRECCWWASFSVCWQAARRGSQAAPVHGSENGLTAVASNGGMQL